MDTIYELSDEEVFTVENFLCPPESQWWTLRQYPYMRGCQWDQSKWNVYVNVSAISVYMFNVNGLIM